mmetsp:Transcript_106192/g.253515  ORF Transcript_106192/g.253515 Transcript_106192/m.253515 type:complete len:420 (-) Transcript_106192:263-1522(-)
MRVGVRVALPTSDGVSIAGFFTEIRAVGVAPEACMEGEARPELKPVGGPVAFSGVRQSCPPIADSTVRACLADAVVARKLPLRLVAGGAVVARCTVAGDNFRCAGDVRCLVLWAGSACACTRQTHVESEVAEVARQCWTNSTFVFARQALDALCTCVVHPPLTSWTRLQPHCLPLPREQSDVVGLAAARLVQPLEHAAVDLVRHRESDRKRLQAQGQPRKVYRLIRFLQSSAAFIHLHRLVVVFARNFSPENALAVGLAEDFDFRVRMGDHFAALEVGGHPEFVGQLQVRYRLRLGSEGLHQNHHVSVGPGTEVLACDSDFEVTDFELVAASDRCDPRLRDLKATRDDVRGRRVRTTLDINVGLGSQLGDVEVLSAEAHDGAVAGANCLRTQGLVPIPWIGDVVRRLGERCRPDLQVAL